jgi:putative ABC transport system permease protein
LRRFVLAQFSARRGRTGALAAGILVAAASFTVLTAAARTSTIQVRGTVESNYRAAYDVLVRPSGSLTRLEREQGLVRPNFLSGIFGGITLAQYEEIKRIPGVAVAAPIANVGYVLPLTYFGIPLNHLLNDDPAQLFRVRGVWRAQRGTSRIPDTYTHYVYYTRRNEFAAGGVQEIVPGRPEPLDVCRASYSTEQPSQGPFDQRISMACFSARSPEAARYSWTHTNGALPLGAIGTGRDVYFPIFLAAIDPVQEARLLGLDRAVVEGRYLRSSDRPFLRDPPGSSLRVRSVPVIASTRTFIDEEVELSIERLRVPDPARAPLALGSRRARSYLEGLEGPVVETRRQAVGPLYERLLAGAFGEPGRVDSFSYWTVGRSRYRQLAPARLAPQTTKNSIAVWESPYVSGGAGGLGYWAAPASNADLQFRRLVSHPRDNTIDTVGADEVLRGAGLKIVGRYDPEELPGFSPLSQVPLETYFPPLLQPADEASRRALGARPLLPSQNLGDYIQQPPLFLTTLEGITPFLDPRSYKNATGSAAPISTIRVRVRGASGPDDLSQARVRQVAELIHSRTGLPVDITAGSSPKPMVVELPKGKFGRPELLLREGWSKKGAAVSFAEAVDRKSIALFSLILLASGFFLGNGALASVRARRSEIGVLLTVGWTKRAIFRAVLTELALIAFVAGVAAAGAAALLARAFSLELSLVQAVLALPLAVSLALAAGFLAAWKAALGTPLDAVRPAVVGRARSRRVRRLGELSVINVWRTPARTLVAVAGLVVGVAALSVLLAIERAFQGVLVDTLLGQAISVQVRSADLVAIALVIVLAGFSVADVLYLNVRERAAELVTLRTVGWEERHLRRVIALEGVSIGILGSIIGALMGLSVGALGLGVPLASLGATAAIAALGGIVVAGGASLVPLARLRALTPPTVFAEE